MFVQFFHSIQIENKNGKQKENKNKINQFHSLCARFALLCVVDSSEFGDKRNAKNLLNAEHKLRICFCAPGIRDS